MDNFQLSIKNGLLTFLAIGAYFLAMESLGLSDNPILRAINIFFVAWGINRTIKAKRLNYDADYAESFKAALLTGFIGISASILALSLYISFLATPALLNTIKSSLLIAGNNTSLAAVSFSLFIEGLASVVIVSFGLMQYWKRNNVISEA